MKVHRKSPVILAVASNGGHWHQMQQILPAFEGASVVTASTGLDTGKEKTDKFHADIQLADYNKNEPGKLFLGIFEAMRTVASVRPNVVVSTGAAPGLMCLFFGRLIGAKTIWIDSIANSEKLSLSGRIAKVFCHTVLTQWQHLSVPGKVQFWGSVI